FVSMLRCKGYDGVLSIEHEDSYMSVQEGFAKAVSYLQGVLIHEPAGQAWWVWAGGGEGVGKPDGQHSAHIHKGKPAAGPGSGAGGRGGGAGRAGGRARLRHLG